MTGALVQLAGSARWAPGHLCITEYETHRAQCYNVGDYAYSWHVAYDDGFMRCEDVHARYAVRPQIHYYECGDPYNKYMPENFQPALDSCVRHAVGIKFPFSGRKERMAARIQAAWRNAIANPTHVLCRRRLLREFEEMRVVDAHQATAQ